MAQHTSTKKRKKNHSQIGTDEEAIFGMPTERIEACARVVAVVVVTTLGSNGWRETR